MSTTARAQGIPTNQAITSDPNNPDSDNDGLLDGEELKLGTNPRSKDTDNDGLSDFQEVRGLKIRELGILKMAPNDADTDNDKRSDGAEAEIKDIEANRWVVNVEGKAPYRVYSHPLVADADFDNLVDGDEFAKGSDPGKGNTDGDRRDDGEEFAVGTNPLQVDFKVTVIYTSLKMNDGGDGDDGNNAGDLRFNFGRSPAQQFIGHRAIGYVQ